jgi:hypothetical protein
LAAVAREADTENWRKMRTIVRKKEVEKRTVQFAFS